MGGDIAQWFGVNFEIKFQIFSFGCRNNESNILHPLCIVLALHGRAELQYQSIIDPIENEKEKNNYSI